MRYEFKKLYLDLVCADGTVVITYLTEVRVLGGRRELGAVEIYHPDGRREVHQARRLLTPLDAAADELFVDLELASGAYTLQLTPIQGSWAPPSQADPRLRWSVRCARAAAEATLFGPTGRRTYRGTSYADWVSIGEPTRRLRPRALSWVRVHTGTASIVLNRIALGDGAAWEQGVFWPLDSRGDLDGPPRAAAVEQHIEQNRLQLAILTGRPPVTLAPMRALHQGSAFDRQRVPRAAHRFICWLLGGPTQECRWLMRVEDSAPGSGWAIHEEVAFTSSPFASRFVSLETERATLELVARTLGCDPLRLGPGTDLVRELGADSLQLVELASAAERHSRRPMSEAQLDSLARPADLFELMREP